MNIESYYQQSGAGEPIVFIHGSYATTSTWKKIVEPLAKTHQCILIKLPGHGGAPEPQDFSHPTIETELSIIKQVVKNTTTKPIHLVGHSYGGVVALAQALKDDLQIQQMTLFEPVSVWVLELLKDVEMTRKVDAFLSKYRKDVINGAPYACGQVIDFWGGKGVFDSLPDFIKQTMQPLVQNNIRHWDVCSKIGGSLEQLRNCTIPTRLVHGTHSNPVAHAIVEHLNKEMLNSKEYQIQGASHFLVTSHVNECIRILNDPIITQ